MHQFVVRSPMIFMPSFRRGSWSLPRRSGSRPESRFGTVTPANEMRAPRAVGVRDRAAPSHSGYVRQRLFGRVLDPGALQVRIEVVDVDELGAASVGGVGNRAHGST